MDSNEVATLILVSTILVIIVVISKIPRERLVAAWRSVVTAAAALCRRILVLWFSFRDHYLHPALQYLWRKALLIPAYFRRERNQPIFEMMHPGEPVQRPERAYLPRQERV